ncbi:mechanosensitive ion channel domain-containing protein [Vibrio sp. WXL210]|uniref:mechanosensitive ion channel domain-containing protein n=1 Tax=Vibrio sp. WXL210 TaxID=3450709 RepID=UPI003EC7A474
MQRLKSWVCQVMLCIGVYLCVFASAHATLPDVETLEAELNQMRNQSSVDEVVVSQYETLLSQLQVLETEQSEKEEYRRIISQFPEIKEKLEQTIAEVPTLDIFKVSPNDDTEDLSLSISSLQAALNQWRSAFQTNAEQSTKLSGDRIALPQALAQLEREIEQTSLSAPSQSDDINSWLEDASLEALRSQRDLMQAELQSLDERTELFRLEQQLLERKIQIGTPLIIQWQERLTDVEQASVKELINRARSMQRSSNNVDEPIQGQLNQMNLEATELEQVLAQIEQGRIDTQRLDTERRNLADEQRLIKENLSWLQGSTSFGASLTAQLQRLPSTISQDTIPDQIAQAHIRKYEIGQQLDDAAIQSAAQSDRMAGPANTPVSALAHQIQIELLANYEKLIVALSKLQLAKNQYTIEVQSARSFLQEQQLWTRSNVPIWENITHLDPVTWVGIPAPMRTFISEINQPQMIPFTILFVLYSVVLFGVNKYISGIASKKRLEYHKIFGHPVKDRFRNSLHLLLLGCAKACSLPIWFGLSALSVVILWPNETTYQLETIIFTVCVGLFVTELLYSLSFPKGLFETHLNWPESVCLYLNKESFRIRWPFLILVILVFLTELLSGINQAELSRVLFLQLLVGMTLIYSALFRKKRILSTLPAPFNRNFSIVVIRSLIFTSFLAIGVMAILGYYILAWMLLIYQQLTIFVVMGFVLVYQLGERWLKLEHRQLTYQRLVARREELIAQQAEQTEEIEEASDLRLSSPEIDIRGMDSEEINEQSMTLLRGLSLIGLIIAVLTLWSSALEMTSMLENVVLWQVSETTASGVKFNDVTLQSFIYALIATLITFVGVRNLPGILELLILRRLELAPGAGYAVTTLLRYVIVVGGVLTAFSLLGFQWSKLQWLVAAFGVGLGFGLQEIFANFISGLILLFERPIRIGDIVTINDLSGTVSKIQTRATTIIDWDNKEIVVPNKTFITEKLINWSLTDPVTRIVIPIGVAYGSDVEKVESLLLEVANEHPLVIEEPSPSVLFLAFGASSLDFELRVHIRAINNRLSTIHILNKGIDKLFRENNVEIAFPQMDIHVRDMPPKPASDQG